MRELCRSDRYSLLNSSSISVWSLVVHLSSRLSTRRDPCGEPKLSSVQASNHSLRSICERKSLRASRLRVKPFFFACFAPPDLCRDLCAEPTSTGSVQVSNHPLRSDLRERLDYVNASCIIPTAPASSQGMQGLPVYLYRWIQTLFRWHRPEYRDTTN